MGLRTVFQRQIVDSSTGEVMEEQKVQVPTPVVGEGFAWVYQKGVERVLKLDPLCVKVWLWCSIRMWSGRGNVTIDRPERLEIMVMCGVKSSTSVSTALAALVKADVLRRVQPGRYVMNPELAWRGRVRARPAAQQAWEQGKEPTG